MRRAWVLALGLLLASAQGCATGAPRAPMGFDRRPANSPATLASLNVIPPARLPRSPAAAATSSSDRPNSAMAPEQPMPQRFAIFVVSDYSAPVGVDGLPLETRRALVVAAKDSPKVTLLCRGDRRRPSWAYRQGLIRRGIKVKRFLVSQGVAADRVRIFTRSSGAFVADNATANGRASNRRVEIHLG